MFFNAEILYFLIFNKQIYKLTLFTRYFLDYSYFLYFSFNFLIYYYKGVLDTLIYLEFSQIFSEFIQKFLNK